MTLPITSDEHEIYSHNPVNVSRWCAGDGSDETAALQAAADEARTTKRGMFMPESLTVRVDGIVNLRYIVNLDLQGIIKVGPEGRVDVGNSSNHRIGAQLRIRRVEQVSPSTQDNVVLRSVGMKQAHIWVDYCDRWEWYADKKSIHDASTSYCTAYPGYIKRLDFVCRNDPDQDGFGWITQVLFIGGDIRHISTDSDSYAMNHITFLAPCLEAGEVHLDRAYRWRFIEARCEYNTKFWFGPNTSRVVVEDGFINDPVTVSPGAIVMEDLGKENVVTSSFEQQYSRRTLVAIDTDNTFLDRCADIAATNIEPGLSKLSPTGTFRQMFDSGLLPVRGQSPRAGHGNVTQWNMSRIVVSSDAAACRPEWYFYRADGTQLTTPEGVEGQGGPTWSSSKQGFTYGTNVSASMVLITNPEVAYVRVKLDSGSPATPFSRIEVIGYFTGQSSDYVADLCRRRFFTPLAQESAPTKGSPPVGTRVRGAGKDWVVGSRQEMTVSPATTGDTSITVSSGINVAVGDVLGLALDTGATHWATILGISGAGGRILELSSPVPAEVSAGAKSVATRWRSVAG